MTPSSQMSRPGLEPALEDVVLRFEAAWQKGQPPRIQDFLAASLPAAGRLKLLKELIKVDLEFRWRPRTPPPPLAIARLLLEDYLQQHPELTSHGKAPLDLISEEYRVRRRFGDNPVHGEYLQRFPDHAAYLPKALQGIDAELAAECSGSQVATPPEAPASVAPMETLPPSPPLADAHGPTPLPPTVSHVVGRISNPPEEDDLALRPSTKTDAPLPDIPGYEILGVLGRGGMGVVYKARQVGLNRIVALKMILAGPHAGAQELARFRTEAEAVARLQHPNIVQIHEIGEHGGLPYFSLEFCAGGSLASQLNGTPLDPRQAAELIETLASAMHAAHQKGIIHRDLKPGNILLQESGVRSQESGVRHQESEGAIGLGHSPDSWLLTPGSSLKITDFGLAKKLDEAAGQTQSGAIMGTPSYMAPEQAEGKIKDIGPATDVYALGAILYEMLTGRPPFKAATPIDTVLQVVADEPVPPRQLQSKVPRDLETICLKCLHKEPARRYGSAAELAEDLRRYRNDEPIEARPVRKVERAWRWCRRNPAVAALIAALVVVFIGAFAGVSWQLGLTRSALAQAEEQQRQRALAQVNALADATAGAVPAILADLAAQRDTVLPHLRERFAQEGNLAKRQRLALALLPVEPDRVRDDLAAWMVQVHDPAEVLLVRTILKAHAADLSEKVWQQVEAAQTGPAARFRALVALASFDATSPRWSGAAPKAVAELLTANPLHLGSWVQGLQPVRLALLPPLVEVFRGQRLAEHRQVAATILADYAADQLQLLADLLMDADEKQYALLYPLGAPSRERRSSLAPFLLAELDKKPPLPKPDQIIFKKEDAIAADDVPIKSKPAKPMPAKWFAVAFQEGTRYRLSLASKEIDSFMVVQDATGKELAFDDDSGGNFDSLLEFTPPRTDKYKIYAAALENSKRKPTGAFFLTITALPPPKPLADQENLARRQANAAVALLKMNQPDSIWPLLKYSPDPRVRSYLIHRFAPLGADAKFLIKRLDEEPDVSIRRALILGLGEYSLPPSPQGRGAGGEGERNQGQITREDHLAFTAKLQDLYRHEPDPGLHAAAEWLLRHWKHDGWLKKVNQDWAKDKDWLKKKLDAIKQILAKEKVKNPQWFVNSQGQTMVVFPGPVEFLMGSPPSEKDRDRLERQHKKRIGRTFALAATPVTKDQFLGFRPQFSHNQMHRFPEPACPIGGVIWYEAAAYCNWLSKEEGIPEDQWCYETSEKSQVVKLRENYLSLAGYRLPTEAEIEYGCRAGTVTSRYFGETDELLGKYAWYFQNSGERTWPVGSKKPNDWGLFDTHGNVWNWCQESYKTYPEGEEVIEDKEDSLTIIFTSSRVLRGGSFVNQASNVRSANRTNFMPSLRYSINGFRPSRTLPLDSFTTLPLEKSGGFSGQK